MVIGSEPSFPVTMSASNDIQHESSPGVHQQCSWPFISNSNSSPNYKILFLTNRLLHTRFLRASYRLSHLQTRQTPGHGTMIYCLQLYTYPITGRQTLFTSSRDKTVKEWDLESRKASRVISGIHTGSVLSICVHSGFLASAGTDGMVVVWDLNLDKLVKVISDHADSVLCVRFDSERMVTCSKGRIEIRSRRLHMLIRDLSDTRSDNENVLFSGFGTPVCIKRTPSGGQCRVDI